MRAVDLVTEEQARQVDLWGEQNHPALPGTDAEQAKVRNSYALAARSWKRSNDVRVQTDRLAWDGILLEEVFEALSEPDREKRIEELIQVAAVAASWAEAERRAALLAELRGA